jgi:hypothetical protein
VSNGTTVKWSGLLLGLAGIGIDVVVLLHPDETVEGAITSSRWALVHMLAVPVLLLAPFGLMGLHAQRASQTGALGLAGFVLLFAGTTMFVAIAILEGFVVPEIAQSTAASLLEESGPLMAGPLGTLFLLVQASFSLGAILYGAAIFQAGAPTKWAGALLLVGGPLVAFAPPLPYALVLLGGVLLGASWLWLGGST